MRRILALLALSCMLFAPVADAITLVATMRGVPGIIGTLSTSQIPNPEQDAGLTQALVTRFLDIFARGSYVSINQHQLRANGGACSILSPSQYRGQQFDQTILCGTMGVSGYTATGFNACSLSTSAAGDGGCLPQKPLLVAVFPWNENGLGVATTACSTGFNTEALDPGRQGPNYSSARARLFGTSLVWQPQLGTAIPVNGYKNAAAGSADSVGGGLVVGGGFRAVIGGDGSNWSRHVLFPAVTPPAFRDSIYLPADYNTLFYNPSVVSQKSYWPYWYQVYFPYNTYGTHLAVNYNYSKTYAPSFGTNANTAPTIFASWNSKFVYDVGTSGAANNRNSLGSPEMVWAGMAMLDSMQSGGLLKGGRPIRQSIQVAGICSRGGMYAGGGFFPGDSVTNKAALDSLNGIGQAITFGVKIDSLNAYAGDITWCKRVSNGRLAPTINMATAFTSYALFSNQLKNWYAELDSAWSGHVDHTVMALNDDWTPSDIGPTGGANFDSLLWAMVNAGCSVVAHDAEADSEFVGASTSIRGVYGPRQWWPIRLGSTYRTFTKVCFPGYNNRGATQGNGYERDSTDATSTGTRSDSMYAAHYMARNILGAVMPYWIAPQDWPRVMNKNAASGGGLTYPYYGEPNLYAQIGHGDFGPGAATTNTSTNIIRITASSLGSGGWGAASPNIPGYYQVKYTLNAWAAINKLAGRPLFVIVPTEQLGTGDFR